MTTARSIINRTYRMMIASEQLPTNQEYTDGLSVLNDVIESMQIEKMYIYATTVASYTMTGSQTSYTIGTGGNFNVTMPTDITNAYVRYNNIDFPMKKINMMDYGNIMNKTFVVGIPQFFAYNAAYPLGTLYFWGTPDQNYTVFLQTPQLLTSFADLDTDYTLGRGYKRFLSYALMQDWMPEFEQEMTPTQLKSYTESKKLIQKNNIVLPVMKTEIGLIHGQTAGYYNWINGI